MRLPVGTTVSEAEKALIQITLQHTKNNKTRAAEILGISLKTLFNKLKEYGAAAEADRALRDVLEDQAANCDPRPGDDRGSWACRRYTSTISREPAIDSAAYRADLITKQVKDYLTERVQEMEDRRATHPATAKELHQDWVEIVRTDPAIPTMLERTTANADLVLNIRIVGRDGRHPGGLESAPARHAARRRAPFCGYRGQESVSQFLGRGVPRRVLHRDAVVRGGRRRPAAVPDYFGDPVGAVAGRAEEAAAEVSALRCCARWRYRIGLGLLLPVLILHPLERLSSRIDSIRTGEPAAAQDCSAGGQGVCGSAVEAGLAGPAVPGSAGERDVAAQQRAGAVAAAGRGGADSRRVGAGDDGRGGRAPDAGQGSRRDGGQAHERGLSAFKRFGRGDPARPCRAMRPCATGW